MKCQKCGHNSLEDHNYCEDCGTAHPEHCKACGEIPGLYKNYCENCGRKLNLRLTTVSLEAESSSVQIENPQKDCQRNDSKIVKFSKPKTERDTVEMKENGNAFGTKNESALININLDRFRSIKDGRCFAKGDIPLVQLYGAIGKYASNLSPDEVLLLADNTVRKNGELGILLSNEYLHYRMDFTDGEKISLNSITSISINKRRFLGNELIVNGKSVYSLGLIPVEFAEQLIELLKSNFSIN